MDGSKFEGLPFSKGPHFAKWVALNVKWIVLKLKMGSSKIEFSSFI
jgi:hypothetical protein